MIALVVGGARCVWDDLKRYAPDLAGWDGPVLACNDVGVTLDRVDHWVSLHWDKLETWAAARRLHHKHDRPTLWTRPTPQGVTVKARITDTWGGSSGMFALKVALEDLGAERAILCGVPMDTQPRFNTGDPWKLHEYRKDWVRYHDRLKDRVRSASGWTRDRFGGPDEWGL